MTARSTNTILDQLRQSALLPDGANLTDGQLLDCYVARREEAVFAALVRRHAPLVWGVCRRVVGNHHDAEDAFQATFLVLVRKAASVRPRERVASFLYGVAYRTALKARAQAVRRNMREKQVPEMPEPAARTEDCWRDLWPLLDRELHGLPERYRLPIVLCDLEGKTHKEAARQLGCPEGTLSCRLMRARTLLARRLARHGLILSGVSLAALVTKQPASAAVPAAVVSATIKVGGVLATRGVAAAAASMHAVTLMKGVLRTMLLTRLKVGLVAVLAAVLGCASLAVLMRNTLTAGPGENKREQPPAKKPATDTPKEDAIKKERQKLQGTWVAIHLEVGGKEDELDDYRLVFSGDECTLWKKGHKKRTWQCKLDPSKSPKELDLVRDNGNRTSPGIYELKDGKLKVCYAERGNERPKQFKTKPHSNEILLVLERAKKP